MPDDIYSVKISRREGSLEITGPDKDWVATQLGRLRVVYEREPPDVSPLSPDQSAGDEAGTARKAERSRKVANGGDESTPRRRGTSGYRGKRNQDLADKLTAEVGPLWKPTSRSVAQNFTDGPNQAAILAAFLQTEVQWETVAPDDLYTIYDGMGWPGPNPRNALGNAKTRKNYFTSAGPGKYRLSHAGERFGRHEAKAGSEE